VGRNRIKRLLRDAFRHQICRLPAVDLVFVPKSEAAAAPNEALREDLARLWDRLSALPPPVAQGTMPAASEPPGAADVTSAAALPT
jgi:ribonuclease P protein component